MRINRRASERRSLSIRASRVHVLTFSGKPLRAGQTNSRRECVSPLGSGVRNGVIYMHPFYDRTGGSSSASSAGTGSSTGGGPGNPAGGSRMAVIGVTRNVRLRRRGNAGFGFSLRGGREYAAGFYVSDVQPGGEAHRNGLRVRTLFAIATSNSPSRDTARHDTAISFPG